MKNYIQRGDTLTFVAPYAVATGAGFLVGSLFAVAASAAANGAQVEGHTVGVFELAKASGEAWSQGAVVYWDDTAKNVTTTATDNLPVGHAVTAAASSAVTGAVRLNCSILAVAP